MLGYLLTINFITLDIPSNIFGPVPSIKSFYWTLFFWIIVSLIDILWWDRLRRRWLMSQLSSYNFEWLPHRVTLYTRIALLSIFFLFLSIYRMTIYFNMKTYLMGEFFWGIPISSAHKTDRNEITVILFKVSLSTITLSLTLTWVCNSLSKICKTKLNISSSYLHSSESVMVTIGI